MTEPECKRPDCHEPRASQFGKYGGLCQRHADEERAASAGAAKPGVVFVTELRKLVEIGKQVDGALLKARKQRPTTDTRRALTEAVGRFQTAATDANLAAMKTAIAAHERATSRPAAQPVDVATPAQSLARKLRSLAAVVEHEAGL